MLLSLARHPLVMFLVILAGIVILDLIFNGHVSTVPAVSGAVGGTVGSIIAHRLRRTSIS